MYYFTSSKSASWMLSSLPPCDCLTTCTCIRITLESCTCACICSSSGTCILRTSLCSTLIHLGTGCLPCCVETVDGIVDSCYITTLVSIFQRLESLLDGRFLVCRYLVAKFQLIFCLENHRIGPGSSCLPFHALSYHFRHSGLLRPSYGLFSSLLKPEEASIRIACSLPVALSLAETFRIPLASMSNVTSIWGIPRRAERYLSVELTDTLVLWCHGTFTWITWMVTSVWLSAAVENTSLFLQGIVGWSRSVLSSRHPLSQYRESEGDVQQYDITYTTFFVSEMAPWIDAPTATTSSGFTPFEGSLPEVVLNNVCTAGIRRTTYEDYLVDICCWQFWHRILLSDMVPDKPGWGRVPEIRI